MNHTKKTYSLNLTNGNEKEFTTKPYTFETEAVIVNRFGREALQAVTAGKHYECDFTLEDVKEDMPKLFVADLSEVDYNKTPVDTFVAVYHFFLSYKRNAWLRQLQLEKETGLSQLEEIRQILNLTPKRNSPAVS